MIWRIHDLEGARCCSFPGFQLSVDHCPLTMDHWQSPDRSRRIRFGVRGTALSCPPDVGHRLTVQEQGAVAELVTAVVEICRYLVSAQGVARGKGLVQREGLPLKRIDYALRGIVAGHSDFAFDSE